MSIDYSILKTNEGDVFVSVNITDKLDSLQKHRFNYILSLFENRIGVKQEMNVFDFLNNILLDSDKLGSFIVFHIIDIKEALS